MNARTLLGIAFNLGKAYALTGLIFNAITSTQGFALCCFLMPFQGKDPLLLLIPSTFGELLPSVQCID